jgi:hypothetical protein
MIPTASPILPAGDDLLRMAVQRNAAAAAEAAAADADGGVDKLPIENRRGTQVRWKGGGSGGRGERRGEGGRGMELGGGREEGGGREDARDEEERGERRPRDACPPSYPSSPFLVGRPPSSSSSYVADFSEGGWRLGGRWREGVASGHWRRGRDAGVGCSTGYAGVWAAVTWGLDWPTVLQESTAWGL